MLRRNPAAVRARVGGRHPGLQEAVALRGAPVERSPRPVRLVRSGSPPLRAVAPATSGCPLGAEEGNVVGVRESRRMHPSRAAPSAPRLGRHVLHSVQGHAHRHVALHARSRGRGAARDRARKGSVTSQEALERHGAGQVRRRANREKSRRNRRRDWVARMLRVSPCVGLVRGASASRSLVPMHQNRDGGCGLLPRTRGHVELEPSARTSWQLQKSSGVVGSRISSRVGLRKEDRRE